MLEGSRQRERALAGCADSLDNYVTCQNTTRLQITAYESAQKNELCFTWQQSEHLKCLSTSVKAFDFTSFLTHGVVFLFLVAEMPPVLLQDRIGHS